MVESKTTELPDNDTRQRILDVADNLFARRGYAAVTLRDIASAVGMKHASLYYYAPNGKRQLFVEVMERSFKRHREGLTLAIAHAGDDLRQQMYAVARWFVKQPPMYLSRMYEADLAELGEEEAAYLMTLAYESLRTPLLGALEKAAAKGILQLTELSMGAMALVTLIQSVHGIPGDHGDDWREKLGLQLVDMLLDGWLIR